MGTYRYTTLDPRSDNAEVFAGPVYGVEVTIPGMAALCEGNLDPQHSGGDHTTAAVQAALIWGLPPDGATLATVRPDLDAVAAMAVLAMRLEGQDLASPDIQSRIVRVARADTFAAGPWQPVALPTPEQPWTTGPAPVNGDKWLAAINAAVSDHLVPLTQRVLWAREWLLSGAEPGGYRRQVEQDRAAMVADLESGRITAQTVLGGRAALVVGPTRAGIEIGYCLAPVVAHLHPSFRFGGGEPHPKWTVAQWAPGYIDLQGVLEQMSREERGWGGSQTIGGSPQGEPSYLNEASVLGVLDSPSVGLTVAPDPYRYAIGWEDGGVCGTAIAGFAVPLNGRPVPDGTQDRIRRDTGRPVLQVISYRRIAP